MTGWPAIARFLIVFPILAIFCVLPVSARPGPVAFSRLGMEQGLSHESIRSLLRDRRGFLWIGTEDGLNRYDGTRTRVYRHRPGDVSSLPANWVQSLYEDRSGTIWIGTASGGFARYLPETDSFQSFTGDFLPQNGVYQEINRIFEDRAGILWLCTTTHLVRVNPQSSTIQKFAPQIPENTHIFCAVLEDKQGGFWIGTSQGLWIFDRATETFALIDPVHWKGLMHFGVTDLALAKDGKLVAASFEGLLIYDTRTRRRVGQFRQSPGGLNSEHLSSVAFLDEETVALGTNEVGLEVLNLKTGAVGHFPADERGLDGPPGNCVRVVLVDRSGILWIGDASYGLGKSSPYANRFRLYRASRGDENSLSDNFIRGVWLERGNILWVGTQNGGLNRIDRNTQKLTRYRFRPGEPGSLPSDNVRTVFQDRSGTIWVGTERGISRLHPDGKSFDTLREVGAEQAVNTISEDRQGNLWFNADRGIARLAPDRRKIRVYAAEIGRDLNQFNDVQCLFEDRLGTIWIGHQGGLTSFTPDKEGFERFTEKDFAIPPTTVWYVTQVSEDRAGNLWVVTKGGGIHRLDRYEKRFIHYTQEQGLPHNNAYGLLEDENRRLWVSTDNGLACFNPETGVIDRYGVADGLQGPEFNRLSFHRGYNGEFFFGGTKGLNSFLPREIQRNPTPPATRIVEVATENAIFQVGDEGSELTLPAGTRRVTVKFAALDFHAPEKNQFQYKLDGFDPDWSRPEPKPEFDFLNLPAGTHVLLVRATNNDGVWTEKPAQIRLVILPPWWRTWWALSLFGLCGVAVAAAVFKAQAVRIRAESLERENRQRAVTENAIRSKNLELEAANLKLRELDELKRGFTAMLVHDLKSPLAVAKGAIEIAEESGEVRDADVLQLLNHGQTSIDRVVSLVNQVLEVFKTESEEITIQRAPVNLNDFLTTCLEQARLAARSKNITVGGTIESELPGIAGDQEKLERVMSNLLSNAIKFTPTDGFITLGAKAITGTGVEEGLRFVLITVTDTGQGIPPADLPYIFDPYRQSQSDQKTRGVGLGLAIVKRLVAAHGGNVSVRSQKGIGSTFSVILPVRNSIHHQGDSRLPAAAEVRE